MENRKLETILRVNESEGSKTKRKSTCHLRRWVELAIALLWRHVHLLWRYAQWTTHARRHIMRRTLHPLHLGPHIIQLLHAETGRKSK